MRSSEIPKLEPRKQNPILSAANLVHAVFEGLLEGPLIGTLVAYGGQKGDYLMIRGLYTDYVRLTKGNGTKVPIRGPS